MNFEEVQMIWDSQKNEPMFTIDQDAMTRIVDQQSFAIHRDLKSLEVTAIVVLIVLGITTLIDTFFNGKEYFQLGSVAFEFCAAGFLCWQRRKREMHLANKPMNLVERIEIAMRTSQTTVNRGRDIAIVFSAFVLYGVAIRVWIYGWPGSEIKTMAAIVCVVMMVVGMKIAEATTHSPRIKSLGTLRGKLLDVS